MRSIIRKDIEVKDIEVKDIGGVEMKSIRTKDIGVKDIEVKNIERCDRCGAKIENGMSRRIDGKNLCVSCFFDMYVSCACCFSMIRKKDAIYLESIHAHVCKDCFENNVVRCDVCGELVPKESIDGYDIDGRIVCALCSSEHYVMCEHCGELIRYEDAVWVESHNYYICETCLEHSDLAICDLCNNVFDMGEVELTPGGYICFNCLSEGGNTRVYEYGYTPKWKFYALGCENHGKESENHGKESENYWAKKESENYWAKKESENYWAKKESENYWVKKENKNLIYLGVELEVDMPNWSVSSDMKLNAIKITKEILGEHVILKNDGSLSTMGFEIVSHPCTLEYHKKIINWKEVFETLVDLGYRSHDTETCGLHVSVRKPNEVELAKLIIFFEKYWDKILKFSRRSESQYKAWCNRYLEDGENIDYEKAKDIVITANDKYRAINISKGDIVEFRIFRGTLNIVTFYATLEFVHGIVMYVKSKGVEEIVNGDWQDFIDWIWENCDCEYLIEYLEDRELI